MSAIIGRWKAPHDGIRQWATDWMHGPGRWSTPRFYLAWQLRYIRKHHGTYEASEFRNYLLWRGVYPVKLRIN